MLAIYARLVASFFWLSHRFEALATRRYGRVGKVLVAVVFGVFTLAGNVLATSDDKNNGGAALEVVFLKLAQLMWWVASGLTQLIVVFIGVATSVMLYNDFSTNKVVSAGWAIVRDTVNMFFVIVLIIIAFGTIFGHSKFQWQQQVPKLMIFALVINFSKTLCGIMIDFGQVVMLTFANAIREIAAGNFIQLFGLTEIYQISPQSPGLADATDKASSGAGGAFDYFAAGMGAIAMVVWVLATIVILTFILLYRVIMLWVMIVLSPLAWFVGGASGVISSNAYAAWWDRFKCLVAVGPVLTFFLWLTLAVAGAGNIATTTNFNVSSDNSAGGLAKIFELDNFMSFLIGMAMLYAGFDAAQQICQSAGGSLLGKALKTGQGVGPAMAGAGIKISAGVGRKVGGVARAGFRNTIGGAVVGGYQNVREKLWRRVGEGAGDGVVGRMRRRAAAKGGSKARGERQAEIERVGKKFENYGSSDVVRELSGFAKKGPVTAEGKKEQTSLFKRLMESPKAMAEMREKDPRGFAKMLNTEGKNIESAFAGDESVQDQLLKVRKQNVHLLDGPQQKDTLSRMKWSDVENIHPDAMGNSAVRKRMSTIQSSVKDKDGNAMMADEALSRGNGGRAAQGWNDKGNQAKAAASAKQDAILNLDIANMDVGEIARVLSKAFSSGGASSAVSNGTQQLQKLTALYQDPSTSAEDRLKLAGGIDMFRGELKGITDNPVDHPFEDTTTSGYAGKQAEDMMNVVGRSVGAIDAKYRFAEIPPAEQLIADGVEPEKLAESVYGNADDSTLSEAAAQIANQLGDLGSKIDGLPTDPDIQEIDNLTASIEAQTVATRQKLMQDKKDFHSKRMGTIERRLSSKGTSAGDYAKFADVKVKIEAQIEQEVKIELKQILAGDPAHQAQIVDRDAKKAALDPSKQNNAKQSEVLHKQQDLMKRMQAAVKKLQS